MPFELKSVPPVMEEAIPFQFTLEAVIWLAESWPPFQRKELLMVLLEKTEVGALSVPEQSNLPPERVSVADSLTTSAAVLL